MVSDVPSNAAILNSVYVLILVLVEYGLGQMVQRLENKELVLILVLMEYGLGPPIQFDNNIEWIVS